MDGNTRFELASASPDTNLTGNYKNGQRGYAAPTLGRSSSFREGSESRGVGSGKVSSRANATSSKSGSALSQCLMLDPIVMGDNKYTRPVDLRRVLNSSVGSISEENSFGSVHPKNSSQRDVEELKRLRADVANTFDSASGRTKKYDEALNKLNKYVESMPSKKQQQRNELLTNERSSGSTLKIGSQMHRNPSELGNQKFDDRPKSVGLNKRVRTSVADSRAECRSNGALRQPSVLAKERDMLKDNNNNADSDVVEEKIRRLPPGGDGWEKKMKRKRSVGAVFSRSVDNDGEMKRNVHQKLTVESSQLPSDSAHGFRSGASGGNNKLDSMPSHAASTARINFKNEHEKPMLSRDVSGVPIKERAIGKVNVKLNSRDDNLAMGPGPIIKGKASRAPRSGSMGGGNSAANSPHMPGTLESWEPPQVMSKTPVVGGLSNRKRSLPASPPITQWGGQRPQKISRTRRTNLIPVSNHDEVPLQSDGCPSDFGPRINVGGTNALFLPKSATNGNQNFKIKSENVASPARLSESEESGAGDARINEKGVSSREMEEKTTNTGQNVAPSGIPMKKNKIVLKDENSDGVRRQGRSGRVSPYSRASISPTSEKLENPGPSKPVRNARSGSEKTGSKSGRPLKKLSDRKGFSRLGHMANGGSPDCSGDSDDDRDDLLTAANLASHSSVNSCSSAFWKTLESLFANVCPDDKSFLLEQLKLTEESLASLSENSIKEEMAACTTNNGELKDSLDQTEFVDQFQNSTLYGGSDPGKAINSVPLYQRVLSALIIEEEIDEPEENGFGIQMNSIYDSHPLTGTESLHTDGLGFYDAAFGVHNQENGKAHNVFPCNGSMDVNRSSSAIDRLCNGELKQNESGHKHPEVEMLARLSGYGYLPQSPQANNGTISSLDPPFGQRLEEQLVLELQSIGLHLDSVPSLDDKESGLSDEIARLQRELREKAGKKKMCLDKIYSGIQEDIKIERAPEQVAMDRLVELAYKKLLATRSSYATKHSIKKLSRQVALSFVKRTLARCNKFEESRESCFSEPALRDVLNAAPPPFAETELLSSVNPAIASGPNSMHPSQSGAALAKKGPISNRGKKKEVLLDDVGGGSAFRASSVLGNLGGAKGKRSERDRDRFPKAGRLSMGGTKGERKAKSKPKQKTAPLGNSFVEASTHPTGPASANKRKDVRFMNGPAAPPLQEETKDSADFTNLPLDGIDGLDMDAETWLNFDMMDGLQDHNSAGLDIPMDDLSELNMF